MAAGRTFTCRKVMSVEKANQLSTDDHRPLERALAVLIDELLQRAGVHDAPGPRTGDEARAARRLPRAHRQQHGTAAVGLWTLGAGRLHDAAKLQTQGGGAELQLGAAGNFPARCRA